MLEATPKVRRVSASLLYELHSDFRYLLEANREIFNLIDDFDYQCGVQFCQSLVAGHPLLCNLSPPVFPLKRHIGRTSDSNFGDRPKIVRRYSMSRFGRIGKLEQ